MTASTQRFLSHGVYGVPPFPRGISVDDSARSAGASIGTMRFPDSPQLVEYLTLDGDDGSTLPIAPDESLASGRPIFVCDGSSTSYFSGGLLAAALPGGLVGSCVGGVLFNLPNAATRFASTQTSGDINTEARPTIRQPRALALLQSWLADRHLSDEEDSNLSALTRELDKDRLGHRRLFETS